MTWYDDGGNKPPHEGWMHCSACHEPVLGCVRTAAWERAYHGACWAAYEAAKWPTPASVKIGQMSHDDRVRDGELLP